MQRAGMVAGGVALLGSFPVAASQAAGDPASGALTAPETATLEVVLAQLLPKDELGPGAVEAGVPKYIAGSLAGSYKPLLSTYQGFLATLDTAAGSAGFTGLSGAEQVKLLEQVESGKTPGVSAAESAAAESAFSLVLQHMREGMFGDPMYGGNKDLAGWDLIGYPGIQLVVTAPLQQIGATVRPTGMSATSYGGEPYDGTPV
jgi:hypothetical protein